MWCDVHVLLLGKMEKITCLNCPTLTVVQIQSLYSSGITTVMDFISAPKEFVCSSAAMDDSEYDLFRQGALEKLQLRAICARQLFSVDRITPKSTGLPSLDVMLGGGIFSGDIVELFGKTGCGKTQLSLYLTSRVCSIDNQSCVLYFDMKNDFNSKQLYQMCNSIEKNLEHVKVFREANLSALLSQLDIIKNEHIGGIDSFYSRCRLLVIDSVPMAIYPAVEQGMFYSWRHCQEQLLRRLQWLADHLNLSVILVNHSVTPREPSTVNGLVKQKSKPAMGKYWQSKINIRIQLERRIGYLNRFRATLDKCYRTAHGQQFEFSIEPGKIVDLNV